MRSYTTERFRKLLRQLPPQIQLQAREAYQLFRQNPSHPGLYFKKVHPVKPIYSARLNIDFRVVGIRDGDEIVWFWIGSHDEHDKLLNRL
jgi:hypothetical protein